MASAEVIDQKTACAKAMTNAANHQDIKTPRKKRQNVAGDKQNKQADEQLPALHFAGQQHKRRDISATTHA